MKRPTITLAEKKAVAGMAAVAVLVLGSIYEIGKRNFWFEAKNHYRLVVDEANGLRVGSVVTIAGVRAGEVTSIEVDDQNRVLVGLNVLTKMAKRLRVDSSVTVFRAFVIGEKQLDIAPGSPTSAELPNGATLANQERKVTDLLEFLSGQKLAQMMTQAESLLGSTSEVMRGLDRIFRLDREGSVDSLLSKAEPALESLMRVADDVQAITSEVRKKSKDLPVFVEGGANLFRGLNKDLIETQALKQSFVNFNALSTPLAKKQALVDNLVLNLEDLSRDMKNNPKFGQKIIEAVSELTVTLRAMQKTWLLEGPTQEVKKEKGPQVIGP